MSEYVDLGRNNIVIGTGALPEPTAHSHADIGCIAIGHYCGPQPVQDSSPVEQNAPKSSGYDELLELAGGERIIGIVFGDNGDVDYVPHDKTDVLLSLEEARPILEKFSFEHGYGGTMCPAITAWTETQVMVVRIYDGMTDLVAIPRNPIKHEPFHIGGGG